MKITPEVFFLGGGLSGNLFNLAGDGEGDLFGTISYIYYIFNKKNENHRNNCFFRFVCLVAVFVYLARDGEGGIMETF